MASNSRPWTTAANEGLNLENQVSLFVGAVPLVRQDNASVCGPIFLILTRCRPDHSFSESRGQDRFSYYLRHGQPPGIPPF